MRLPAQFVEDRDARIWQARNEGMSYRQIAQALNISTDTAHKGFLRQQKRIAKIAAEDAVEGIWSHLEKIDALERQLWPMARERKITVQTPNGPQEEIIAPSMDAIRELQNLLKMRSKAMGWDKDVVLTGPTRGTGPSMEAEDKSAEKTTEDAARELTEEYLRNGIITGPAADALQKALSIQDNDSEVVEAEIVEDLFAIGAAKEDDNAIPEGWVDEEDLEYEPGGWVPENAPDGNSLHNAWE